MLRRSQTREEVGIKLPGGMDEGTIATLLVSRVKLQWAADRIVQWFGRGQPVPCLQHPAPVRELETKEDKDALVLEIIELPKPMLQNANFAIDAEPSQRKQRGKLSLGNLFEIH